MLIDCRETSRNELLLESAERKLLWHPWHGSTKHVIISYKPGVSKYLYKKLDHCIYNSSVVSHFLKVFIVCLEESSNGLFRVAWPRGVEWTSSWRHLAVGQKQTDRPVDLPRRSFAAHGGRSRIWPIHVSWIRHGIAHHTWVVAVAKRFRQRYPIRGKYNQRFVRDVGVYLNRETPWPNGSWMVSV